MSPSNSSSNGFTEIASIANAVQQAAADKKQIQIVGGNSKTFYGHSIAHKLEGQELVVSGYQGVVSYEPTELVITARCGTSLKEIESVLADQNQMLPFEPPHFAETATIGGTIACGLSGPARPFTGSVRDYVLGVRMINGKGEDLTFGGQVMKNVAGFDVSRLMTGSLGTLGIISEVSLKLLPKPEAEITIQQECDQKQALEVMNKLAGQPLPLSAACHVDGILSLRLSGFPSALKSAHEKIGGQLMQQADVFWRSVKEQQHSFFSTNNDQKSLWKISVPPATTPLNFEEDCFVDWGGAQRWYCINSKDDLSVEEIRHRVAKHKGHATLFRSNTKLTSNKNKQIDVFSPLSPEIKKIHHRIKQSFDPDGIFNIGKMYKGF
ncbi:MAG: glycolate oxidase subunit GlcE [Gammaproteobacteria bacterium]